MPAKSLAVPLPTAREKPVQRRVDEDQVGLVEKAVLVGHPLKGAGPVGSGLAVTTRTGPSDPMCSQSVAEPGPPL